MSLSRIDALLTAQEGLKNISRAGIEEMQLRKLKKLELNMLEILI